MAVGGGPEQVRQACEAAVSALVAGMPVSGVAGSRAQWAAAIGAVQQLLNVADGVQDAAIARLAAIEPEWCEDGTLVESHRGLGHVALDAPAILSGVLNVAAVHAERRVVAAVRLAADGPAGSATETGLAGLHAAMTAGVLDAYRAGVVAEELAYAPGEVAQAVVAALAPYFAVEDGPRLRRRCRRVLARISPDLLLQRAKRARASCGLRRWAEEPGVDRWDGTFPSEDAARAWAAIDALAQQYVKDGTCSAIEQARGKALTDLVTSNATIQAVITLTVPAAITEASEPAPTEKAETAVAVEPGASNATHATSSPGAEATASPATARDGDLVEVSGLNGTQPVLVPRGWVTTTIDHQRETDPRKVTTAACHPTTGALTDPGGEPSGTDAYRPPARLARLVRGRDRRCRFPGCTVAAVFCDLDHVRPWPTGPTTADNLFCLCRRHHRTKQRPGWHLTLHPDGTATWTDPTGQVRTTDPVDALHPLVLPDTGTAPDTGATIPTRLALSDGPHSDLELTLEHHAAALPRTTTTWRHQHTRRRHHTDLIPATDPDDQLLPGNRIDYDHLAHNHRSRTTDPPGAHDPWARWRATRTRRRRRAIHHDTDPPPF